MEWVQRGRKPNYLLWRFSQVKQREVYATSRMLATPSVIPNNWVVTQKDPNGKKSSFESGNLSETKKGLWLKP